jgi:hypothetical protein
MTIPTSGPTAPVQPADPTPVPPSANAQLDSLVHDPAWAKRFFDGDPAARTQFNDLTGKVAAVRDDVDAAIAGTAIAPSPLVETVVDGELPFHARSAVIEGMRATGLNDATIAEALKGEPVTRVEVEAAKRYQAMRHADPEWVSKLLKGDWQARKEQLLLSIILTNPVKA